MQSPLSTKLQIFKRSFRACCPLKQVSNQASAVVRRNLQIWCRFTWIPCILCTIDIEIARQIVKLLRKEEFFGSFFYNFFVLFHMKRIRIYFLISWKCKAFFWLNLSDLKPSAESEEFKFGRISSRNKKTKRVNFQIKFRVLNRICATYVT